MPYREAYIDPVHSYMGPAASFGGGMVDILMGSMGRRESPAQLKALATKHFEVMLSTHCTDHVDMDTFTNTCTSIYKGFPLNFFSKQSFGQCDSFINIGNPSDQEISSSFRQLLKCMLHSSRACHAARSRQLHCVCMHAHSRGCSFSAIRAPAGAALCR